MRKKIIKHGIAIIGVAILIFLSVASATNDAAKLDNSGIKHYENKEYDEAIADFTESLRLSPNYFTVYFYRARAYYAKGDYDQAIADYDQAIKLHPKYSSAFNNRGLAFEKKGDISRAIADYETALRLDPNNDIAKNNLERIRQNVPVITQTQNAPVNVQSEDNYVQSDEDFEIKQNADNTLTITGYKGKAKNVVIPATLYGLKVTVIGSSAFNDKGLRSVVIPDTVITIEDGVRSSNSIGAFSHNVELTKVTLGNGLKNIGDCAFLRCLSLAEIIIPNSVTRIGEVSFFAAGRRDGDSEVFKVTFGTGLQTIGAEAFRYSEIVELNLPSSLSKIEERAFADNKIQKIIFGSGLQIIRPEAFRNNQITELNLPSSLKTIDGGAFANNQIQSLTIPNGVTNISNYYLMNNNNSYYLGAFANNPLTTLIIPESLANGGIRIRLSRETSTSAQNFGNTITRITIPARMDEQSLKDNFEEAFVNFWINQNRAGGTYIKRGPIWTKE
jgi:hypothetical protein